MYCSCIGAELGFKCPYQVTHNCETSTAGHPAPSFGISRQLHSHIPPPIKSKFLENIYLEGIVIRVRRKEQGRQTGDLSTVRRKETWRRQRENVISLSRARGKRTPWRTGEHIRELGHSEPGTKLSSSLGQEDFGYKFIYLCIYESLRL